MKQPAPILAVALVGIGAAAGTTLRYLAGLASPLAGAGSLQPHLLVTLAINLLGSFLLGFLAGWLTTAAAGGTIAIERSARLRLLLGTGLLGGFTTYSTFALEAVTTARAGAPLVALGYVVMSVAAGVALAWYGNHLARRRRRQP